MHIGLIGGIGVAATLVYYQRLTTAVQALGGPLELTISHGDIQTLIRNNLADQRMEQAQVYGRAIDQLAAAGADCVAITSLGGHFCFEETQALSKLPLVSALTPLDGYFQAQGIHTIGVLGTRVVMRTGLYGQLQHTKVVALEDEIETLGQSYQDMAVAGVCRDAQQALFLDAGARLVRDCGADAVVLAGTDLNLAFDGQDTEYRVIDALDIHVDVLARLAVGQITLATALGTTNV
ncbi:MAG: aspartate racemase [Sulfitobacter sp.]|jgi:aspartate racemase